MSLSNPVPENSFRSDSLHKIVREILFSRELHRIWAIIDGAGDTLGTYPMNEVRALNMLYDITDSCSERGDSLSVQLSNYSAALVRQNNEIKSLKTEREGLKKEVFTLDLSMKNERNISTRQQTVISYWQQKSRGWFWTFVIATVVSAIEFYYIIKHPTQ